MLAETHALRDPQAFTAKCRQRKEHIPCLPNREFDLSPSCFAAALAPLFTARPAPAQSRLRRQRLAVLQQQNALQQQQNAVQIGGAANDRLVSIRFSADRYSSAVATTN